MRRRAPAALLTLLALATSAPAAWDPPGWRRASAREASSPTQPAVLPALWAVGFFRAFVSPVDGDRCPSQPTCSTYALEALQEEGPVLGSLLTAARLVSEADQAAFSPRVFVGGRWKVYAPVADDLAFLSGPLAP